MFLSFLSFYECHPLKIVTHKTKDLVGFYRKEYFEDLARRLAEIEKQSFSILNLLFLGNLYGLFDHLPRFLKNYESVDSAEKVVLVFSPLEQIAFKKKWKESMNCRFIHLGLDAKFYQEDAQRSGNDVTIVRDIVLETQREEKELKKLAKIISSGDATSLHIVWDCEVFASDYFPGNLYFFECFWFQCLYHSFFLSFVFIILGLSQFFPFSYSKGEIWKLVELLIPLVNAADSFIVTNYNPTVEEYRSYNYLANFLHSLFFHRD